MPREQSYFVFGDDQETFVLDDNTLWKPEDAQNNDGVFMFYGS